MMYIIDIRCVKTKGLPFQNNLTICKNVHNTLNAQCTPRSKNKKNSDQITIYIYIFYILLQFFLNKIYIKEPQQCKDVSIPSCV